MRRLWTGIILAAFLFVSMPASAAPFIPTCYNLPKYQVADPSWQYSHQCRENTTIWYVYVKTTGQWVLVSTTIMP